VVVHDQYGAACDFAAGAAGGGHGNDGRHAVGDFGRAAFDGGVGLERPLMGGQNRHALGAVDGAAAAHGNQTVAMVGRIKRGGSAHRGFGRVRRRLVKHAERQAVHDIEYFLQHASGLDAGIGDDQGPRDANPLALLAQQLDSAGFKLDLGQVIDE